MYSSNNCSDKVGLWILFISNNYKLRVFCTLFKKKISWTIWWWHEHFLILNLRFLPSLIANAKNVGGIFCSFLEKIKNKICWQIKQNLGKYFKPWSLVMTCVHLCADTLVQIYTSTIYFLRLVWVHMLVLLWFYDFYLHDLQKHEKCSPTHISIASTYWSLPTLVTTN